MFGKTKAKFEAKIERERNRWKSPVTADGTHLSNAEGIIFLGVFVVFVLVAGLIPPIPVLHLAVAGLCVLALSSWGRSALMPVVYGLMAQKFGWSPYEEAVRKEAKARQAEREGLAPQAQSTAQPAAAVTAPAIVQAAPALSGSAREVLEQYLHLSLLDRLSRAEQVASFLIKEGAPFTMPEQDEDAPEDYPKAINKALRDLAKVHGIEVKPVIAGVAHAQ